MKTVLLLLIALSLSAEPLYLESDKQKHFIGSMAIGGAASGIARHYGSNRLESFAISVATSLLVGIAKEAVDGKGYGTEDIGDVYADTLGAISGSMISAQFNWRF